ncbi:hypothetical protein FB446DRAFT_786163 [Lentinula raphanica]|nr:hypothetical protein FB446DRAFT_786163 [Lentinula raphanica]
MKISSVLSKSSLHALSVFFLLVSPLGSIASPMLQQHGMANTVEDVKLWIIPDHQHPSARNIGLRIGNGQGWETYRQAHTSSDGVQYLQVRSTNESGGDNEVVVGSLATSANTETAQWVLTSYGYYTIYICAETVLAKLKDVQGFTQSPVQEAAAKAFLAKIIEHH